MKYFFIGLFSFLVISSYGQTMTAYEKKSYSLTFQFLRKLGVDEAVLKKNNKMSDLEKLIVAGNFLEKLNTEKGLMLMFEYEREMKEAEKLKTAVDFQRDNEKKAEAEQKKQIEIAKQKEKQRQAELENQEKEKKERYNNSDYVQIKSTIKEDFNPWLQKGEFEKTEGYQSRIANNSSVTFDSICYKNLIHAFKEKSGFSSNLLKYNADTEKFGIEFTFNDIVFNDSFNVPIKEAAKFKDEVENFGIYVADKDWGFIDNYLTPTKITYYNNDTKESFEFYFRSKDLKRISFSISELRLNSSITINTKFNFDEFYYNRMFEAKDGSAINSMARDCLLNQNFSEALQILQRGVPLINNSDEIYPYLLTNLAHAYLFDNQFDRAHKIYFENLTLKLNDKTWKDAILQDFIDFKKRGIKSVDMEKVKQELLGLR
jgi:hypothetical protein